MIKKIGLSLLLTVSFLNGAWAAGDDNSNTASAPQTANEGSQAMQFAYQAGAIAGITQACGQNTDDFARRIAEAVKKLALDPTDEAGAILFYQKTAREAQTGQQKTQRIPCATALQNYRSLPIMQADYKEKVIAQLGHADIQR